MARNPSFANTKREVFAEWLQSDWFYDIIEKRKKVSILSDRIWFSFIGILLESSTFSTLFTKPKNLSTAKLSISKHTRSYRDEARHGKAFEGRLNRYFK